MRIGLIKTLGLVICLCITVSCKRNPYKIKVSSIPVDIEIKRLEADLFTPDPSEIRALVPSLKKQYGDFFQLFSYVINAGNIDEPSFGESLLLFCTDKLNNEVYSSVMELYQDVSSLEAGLEDAFRHYAWYFPRKTVPAVFTCITGFNNSIITGDSAIGISLDRYLGRQSEYYLRLGIYRYAAARMNPYNIIPDCIYGWGSTEWDFADMKYPGSNVMAEMIHEGKLKYFEKCMLPLISDTLLFGFTASQMKFCRNNESQMWLYLVEKNLLFSSDQFVIRKLTGEAPFTSYFTSESPGKAAVWLGFRIVESFMMLNRDIYLEELMNSTDLQSILDKAKYNPQ